MKSLNVILIQDEDLTLVQQERGDLNYITIVQNTQFLQIDLETAKGLVQLIEQVLTEEGRS